MIDGVHLVLSERNMDVRCKIRRVTAVVSVDYAVNILSPRWPSVVLLELRPSVYLLPGYYLYAVCCRRSQLLLRHKSHQIHPHADQNVCPPAWRRYTFFLQERGPAETREDQKCLILVCYVPKLNHSCVQYAQQFPSANTSTKTTVRSSPSPHTRPARGLLLTDATSARQPASALPLLRSFFHPGFSRQTLPCRCTILVRSILRSMHITHLAIAPARAPPPPTPFNAFSTFLPSQVIRLAPEGLSEVATLKTDRRKIIGNAGSKLRWVRRPYSHLKKAAVFGGRTWQYFFYCKERRRVELLYDI